MMACCDEYNDDDDDDIHNNYSLTVAVLSFGKDTRPTNQNITIEKNVGNNNRIKTMALDPLVIPFLCCWIALLL
jgi:hypothetical protein